MEAIFRPETFRTFSDDFRPIPIGRHRKLIGIRLKKSGQLPAGILLPVPENSSLFLQDSVIEIFDLGMHISYREQQYLMRLHTLKKSITIKFFNDKSSNICLLDFNLA
jgi:hypothetical protein